ncbi:MAG TPA: helix-turn-helix domain-containing protein [Parvibaculum sp.]|jgi:putative transcriptional regulator
MIAIKLREAIERHQVKTGIRLTYEDIAERTGLSLATLQSLASRANYNATLKTVEKLCQALDCEPGDLLEIRKSPPDGNKVQKS